MQAPGSRDGNVDLSAGRSISRSTTYNYLMDFHDILYINGPQRMNPNKFGDHKAASMAVDCLS